MIVRTIAALLAVWTASALATARPGDGGDILTELKVNLLKHYPEGTRVPFHRDDGVLGTLYIEGSFLSVWAVRDFKFMLSTNNLEVGEDLFRAFQYGHELRLTKGSMQIRNVKNDKTFVYKTFEHQKASPSKSSGFNRVTGFLKRLTRLR